MREIKFRVWSESRKKWLNECMFDMEVKGAYDFSSDSSMRYNYKTDVIIEQFTGLKDVNGVEIYEGDIFNDGIAYCVIKWNADTASFVSFDGDENHEVGCYLKNETIIGNIHQHPELLEGDK